MARLFFTVDPFVEEMQRLVASRLCVIDISFFNNLLTIEFMEKKKYVTPVAEEEAFVANCYVAKCTMSLTGNGMRCINPYHNHYGSYFTYVWIQVVGDACATVVDDSTTKSWHPGTAAQPNEPVLFKNGTTKTADNRVTVRGNTYYVPSGLTTTQILEEDCYGLYYNEGSATQNVLS